LRPLLLDWTGASTGRLSRCDEARLQRDEICCFWRSSWRSP